MPDVPDRPWNGLTVLDAFCCAGGAGMGYWLAGFNVVGVDIRDQPNYPFPFLQADAVEYIRAQGHRYDLVHTSPPCQSKCALTVGTNASQGWGGEHVDLVEPTRAALAVAGRPHVIEQPNGKAPIRKDVSLCGEMYGLRVLRHRNFELAGVSVPNPTHPKHRGRVRGYRHGQNFDGPYVAAYGSGGGKASVPEMQEAMGIWWTDVRSELTEAIPPAYTRWLGEQIASQLTTAATAA